MSKTFRYTKFTGHYYCQYSDEWEEDGVEFDYEVEDSKLIPVIVDLLYDEYFKNGDDEDFVKETLARIIEEKDLVGGFAYYYEEDLHDIFEKEAMEWYDD